MNMITATYQGRRVQVLGESKPMTVYSGEWQQAGEELVIIREIGENIVAGVDSTRGVESSELGDYREEPYIDPYQHKIGNIITIEERKRDR